MWLCCYPLLRLYSQSRLDIDCRLLDRLIFLPRSLNSLLQRPREFLHSRIAVVRVLLQGAKYNALNLFCDMRILRGEGFWLDGHLLINNLFLCAIKGWGAAEPFIDDDAERVLVAGTPGVLGEPLRSHIGYRSDDIFLLY